jgi:large subunit ribosomal protein L3
MTLGVVGRKLGMTRVFDESGVSTPVTVIEVAKNRITARKTPERDGYSSVQVTTGEKKANLLRTAQAGHFA